MGRRPRKGSTRVLVAGIGNIFLGDDSFGVEVVKRLASLPLPEGVRVVDVGIRGIHLAYDLMEEPCETVIFVDAAPRGGEPGTVYLIEPDAAAEPGDAPSPDAHGMRPEMVLQYLHALGGLPPRLFIVGCEPAVVDEEMGLSPAAERAVDAAIRLILEVVDRELERVPAS